MQPRSLLTRRLFRAIVANQPYHTAACPLRAVTARSRPTTIHARPAQRRGLFGISLGSTAKELAGQRPTPQNVEKALVKLSECVQAKRSRSRPPADHELLDAVRFLANTRVDQQKPMTRNEVYLATETFQHLIDRDVVLSDKAPKTLTTEDLRNILTALMAPIGQEAPRTDSIAMAELILAQELKAQPKRDLSDEGQAQFWHAYVQVLASSGAAQKALDHLYTWDQAPLHVWQAVLSGLYAENLFDKFWAVVDQSLTPELANFLVQYLSIRDDIDGASRVWDLAQDRDLGSLIEADSAVALLQCGVRTGQLGRSVDWPALLTPMIDQPGIVGALLLWHAFRGTGPSDVLKLATTYSEQGADITMTEMNQLVEYAYMKRDPVLADQYVHVAQSRGAVPDAQTFASKLNYELSIGDLVSAQATFEALSIQDVPTKRVDIPVLNKYATNLASAPTIDLQLITRVIDRIVETDGELEATTLAALSAAFLKRNELDEAMNVLRFRVEYLPAQGRAIIAQVFKDFINDLSIKDQRAFDAYELLRAAFPETKPADRLVIMESFFDRKRSDLACLVFGHMRQRQEIENRPTDEAYARCFYGIAQCRDVDGLQMIYNMIKMDIYVEQSTKVHNAMMAAYTACQTPFSAIIDHYWKILDSREGPTLSTFKLALRACETWIGAGGEEARRIMALMQKWDLLITKDIYHCYIGALAGQSQFETTVELIEHMEEDTGEAPDPTTIGTFYNAIPWQYRKDEVEAWARKIYPDLWEELVSYGDEIDEEWEVRYFNINRDIDVDDELLFGQGQYTPTLAQQARLGLPAPGDPDAPRAAP